MTLSEQLSSTYSLSVLVRSNKRSKVRLMWVLPYDIRLWTEIEVTFVKFWTDIILAVLSDRRRGLVRGSLWQWPGWCTGCRCCVHWDFVATNLSWPQSLLLLLDVKTRRVLVLCLGVVQPLRVSLMHRLQPSSRSASRTDRTWSWIVWHITIECSNYGSCQERYFADLTSDEVHAQFGAELEETGIAWVISRITGGREVTRVHENHTATGNYYWSCGCSAVWDWYALNWRE